MKIESSYIYLKGARYYAYHGVSPQETLIGNEYTIDLRAKVDIARAAETDQVADTLNYAEVQETIKAEMDIPSRLLEHVAARILRRLFDTFPSIVSADLRLSKRNPPMGADIDAAGVEISCSRG